MQRWRALWQGKVDSVIWERLVMSHDWKGVLSTRGVILWLEGGQQFVSWIGTVPTRKSAVWSSTVYLELSIPIFLLFSMCSCSCVHFSCGKVHPVSRQRSVIYLSLVNASKSWAVFRQIKWGKSLPVGKGEGDSKLQIIQLNCQEFPCCVEFTNKRVHSPVVHAVLR
jgi:hypothetical protein